MVGDQTVKCPALVPFPGIRGGERVMGESTEEFGMELSFQSSICELFELSGALGERQGIE